MATPSLVVAQHAVAPRLGHRRLRDRLPEEFVEQRDDIRVLAGEVENEMSKLVQN